MTLGFWSDPTPKPIEQKLSELQQVLKEVSDTFADVKEIVELFDTSNFDPSSHKLLVCLYNFIAHEATNAKAGVMFSSLAALLQANNHKEATLLMMAIGMVSRAMGRSDNEDGAMVITATGPLGVH